MTPGRARAPRRAAQVNGEEKRQKLPVNESINFSIVLTQHPPSREKDAHFLVSLKKSKKDRKAGAARRSVLRRLLHGRSR